MGMLFTNYGNEEKISTEECLKCFKEGMSIQQISEKYNCATSTIFRKLEKCK